MFSEARLGCLLVMTLLCAATTLAQQDSPDSPDSPETQPVEAKIHLDVVVSPKSGPPVSDLQQQDFTLLDNKAPRAISSFEAVSGREAPIEVVLVIDAINTDYQHLSVERAEIDKFLRAEGGHLAYPMALAVFQGNGIQTVEDFSSDGNVLSASLDQEVISLRSIDRTGLYGEVKRLQLSLMALHQLIADAEPPEGRRVIIWVSPGWSPINSTNTVSPKQQGEIFQDIVSLSTNLQQARITLYSVDPLGISDPEVLTRDSSYREYLKGVSKPSQVSFDDLDLQVLAIQSGGLAFNSSNDISGVLQECLAAATAPYYEITLEPPPAVQRNEYHHLEIKLAKPGLTARTRQSYYAQPRPRD